MQVETAIITPTQYSADLEYGVLSDPENMLTGVDSTTYSTITFSADGYANHVYLSGFDFSLIPNNAIISAFRVKFKAGYERSLGATIATTAYYLYKSYAGQSQSTYIYASSTPGWNYFTNKNAATSADITWEDIVSNMSDEYPSIALDYTSRTDVTAMIFGAQIEVNYEIPHGIFNMILPKGA